MLESSEDYYSTPTYYRTIANEEGYVFKEDGTIINEVKKYVKKDSYAHKYFIEHGATDNLIVEE
ncbi:MAG: hypothetical protein IJC76_09630 [Lachnospiraceae bacterium]|nr:hypothetical protein [Lachnospiraceae bacterium]